MKKLLPMKEKLIKNAIKREKEVVKNLFNKGIPSRELVETIAPSQLDEWRSNISKKVIDMFNLNDERVIFNLELFNEIERSFGEDVAIKVSSQVLIEKAFSWDVNIRRASTELIGEVLSRLSKEELENKESRKLLAALFILTLDEVKEIKESAGKAWEKIKLKLNYKDLFEWAFNNPGEVEKVIEKTARNNLFELRPGAIIAIGMLKLTKFKKKIELLESSSMVEVRFLSSLSLLALGDKKVIESIKERAQSAWFFWYPKPVVMMGVDLIMRNIDRKDPDICEALLEILNALTLYSDKDTKKEAATKIGELLVDLSKDELNRNKTALKSIARLLVLYIFHEWPSVSKAARRSLKKIKPKLDSKTLIGWALKHKEIIKEELRKDDVARFTLFKIIIAIYSLELLKFAVHMLFR